MSTRSSIFLTNDNEHCYYELAENDEPIYLEMSKQNIEIEINDDNDFVVRIKPNTELYKLISSIKQ